MSAWSYQVRESTSVVSGRRVTVSQGPREDLRGSRGYVRAGSGGAQSWGGHTRDSSSRP